MLSMFYHIHAPGIVNVCFYCIVIMHILTESVIQKVFLKQKFRKGERIDHCYKSKEKGAVASCSEMT